MPRWDYECGNCNNIVTVSSTNVQEADEKKVYCRQCRSETPMERLPSAPAFVLKGGGWPGKEIKGTTKPKEGHDA
jgi:putative FmdB family regulatory protein